MVRPNAYLSTCASGVKGAQSVLLHRWHRGEEALTKAQLLKDFDEFHDVTEEPETEYVGYEFGKRSGSKETPEKQRWIRREFMPEDKMAELVQKYTASFSREEIEDHWTSWVLQGKSWKNMEGPVRHYHCIQSYLFATSAALPVLSALFWRTLAASVTIEVMSDQ